MSEKVKIFTKKLAINALKSLTFVCIRVFEVYFCFFGGKLGFNDDRVGGRLCGEEVKSLKTNKILFFYQQIKYYFILLLLYI